METNISNNITITKVCKVCQTEKTLDNYYKHKNAKYGCLNICKSCFTIHNKTYYANHKDAVIAKITEWQAKHPKKQKQYKRAWLNRKKQTIINNIIPAPEIIPPQIVISDIILPTIDNNLPLPDNNLPVATDIIT